MARALVWRTVQCRGAGCGTVFALCGSCYRGQVYCGDHCRATANDKRAGDIARGRTARRAKAGPACKRPSKERAEAYSHRHDSPEARYERISAAYLAWLDGQDRAREARSAQERDQLAREWQARIRGETSRYAWLEWSWLCSLVSRSISVINLGHDRSSSSSYFAHRTKHNHARCR